MRGHVFPRDEHPPLYTLASSPACVHQSPASSALTGGFTALQDGNWNDDDDDDEYEDQEYIEIPADPPAPPATAAGTRKRAPKGATAAAPQIQKTRTHRHKTALQENQERAQRGQRRRRRHLQVRRPRGETTQAGHVDEAGAGPDARAVQGG